MKMYLVGGAVRDMIMGVKSQDHDFVVVGSSEQEMLDQGFKRVGSDFPVFLKGGSEYALARKEKKEGKGYLGFVTEFGPEVTLEEDLVRRDLTINSMAVEEDNCNDQLIDPYGGSEDLSNKILRHTSNAFREDPVRVLRVARFKARFGPTWSVAPETMELMEQMGKDGVLSELTRERVWKEFSRALLEKWPEEFFNVLRDTGTLDKIFPQIETVSHHVKEALAFSHESIETRFSVFLRMFTDVGKAEDFCAKLNVPKKIRNIATKIARYRLVETKTAKEHVDNIVNMGFMKDEDLVRAFLNTEASYYTSAITMGEWIQGFHAMKKITHTSVFPDGESDSMKIREGMFNARLKAFSSVW